MHALTDQLPQTIACNRSCISLALLKDIPEKTTVKLKTGCRQANKIMAYILGLARSDANRRGFNPTLQLNLILLFNIVAPATFFVTAARVVRHEWHSQSGWRCTRSVANRTNHRLLYMCGASLCSSSCVSRHSLELL